MRNKKVGSILLLSAMLMSGTGFASVVYPSGLTGAWEFNDTNDLLHADTGNDLVLTGSHTAVAGFDGEGAIEIGVGSYYHCAHNIAGNGGSTDRVNNYTILMDIKIPSIGSWYSFFQTDVSNGDDGDAFVNLTGMVGIAATGYSTVGLVPEEWYRLAISVSLGNHYDYYLDGDLVHSGGIQDLNGRFALYSESNQNGILFFADNNGEDNPFQIGRIAIFERDLNSAEIMEMGGFHKAPPDISMTPYLQTPSSSSITVNWHKSESTESIVDYGTTAALGQRAVGDTHTFDPNTLWHQVRLTGLQPDTEYFYRCKTGTSESDIYAFRTFPVDSVSQGHFRIGVLGDTRTTPNDHKMVIDAIRDTAENLYGKDIQNQLNLVINVGDLVTHGAVLSQYLPQYFEPVMSLSTNVPFMVSIGNHEFEDQKYYQYMDYEGLGGPEGEIYYSFRGGPIYFLMLNSNTRGDQQLEWVKNELIDVQADESIDWVLVFTHHPGHSELWPDGNNSWVNNQLIPILSDYDKVCGLYYGHSHNYEVGAHPDAPFHLLLSGGGGSNLDRWGMYNNQQDYPELYKSWDHYGYTILDFDLANRSYTAKTYTLGHKDLYIDNQLVDEFYQKREGTSAPETPTGLSPVLETSLPPVLVATPYVGVEEIMASHFQVTSTSGNYASPIVDRRRDWVNFYGDTGAPNYDMVDLNNGIDLSRLVLNSGISDGQTYFWRIRYRDQNLIWSEWSEEQQFTVNNNLPPVADLRAWWKLDESTGSVAADSSENGLDASNTGGVLVGQTGYVDGAFTFDGVDGCSTTTGTDAPNSSILTITAWIHPSLLSDKHVILGKRDQFIFETSGNKLRMISFPNRSHYSDAVLVANEWQFVVVTFTPSTTGGCRFYRNGVLIGTADSVAINQNSNALSLGKSQAWNQHFEGGLDEIRLYNRVLTDAEINTLYQQDAGIYNQWKGTKFTAAELTNPAISGDAADVDADQLSTLVEYALGLDPKTHSGSLAGCAIELDGSNGWKVEFNRHASHSDIDLILEWSDELNPANWQPVAQSIAGGVVQPLNGASLVSETGSEPTVVELNVPSTVPHGFIRWKVERQ